MGEEQELFSAILTEPAQPAETPAPEPEQPAPQPAPDERPRDEKGRFAPSQPGETPEPEQPAPAPVQEPPVAHHVPLRELLDERERRQKFEREIAEERKAREALQRQIQDIQRANKPPAATPDIFDQPQAFVESIQDYVRRQLAEHRGEISLQNAHRQYGEEFMTAYQGMLQTAQLGDQAAWRSVVEARDPGEALIQWHRQKQIMEKTGGNLDNWMAQQFESPEFQKRYADYLRGKQSAQAGQRPAVSMPPSLSKVPQSGPQSDQGGESDAALLHNALRR